MNFRISDTFTGSLIKLSAQEQKCVKTTVFDLQVNPSQPSLSFHKVERAKDSNFWSIRASSDLRVIIHKTAADLLVCYVGHHDDAYHWAERRKIEQHPQTGAIQLIEIRQRVEEIPVFVPAKEKAATPRQLQLFANVEDETLLSFGVPAEWLCDVRLATEESLLDLADHLPQEAAEALLELATGGTPETVAKTATKGFEHPDAQRRFRLVTNENELALALDYPWDKWTIFLHPSQKSVVERKFNGPARITGSAGTGKTIVALHRAAWLARRNPTARILLTTFSAALADLLATKLDRLVGKDSEIRRQIILKSLPSLAHELANTSQLASSDEIAGWSEVAIASIAGHFFSKRIVVGEWKHFFDAWQITDLDSYLTAPRSGMKTRLGSKQREIMFQILCKIREQLLASGKKTWPGVYHSLAATHRATFDHVIVDEAQDLGVAELRFVAALAASGADNLLLAGDTGQRIFQPPFSWKSLGIDIRGRSTNLRVNYRTSHQIRQHADRLLPEVIRDVDGNEESRKGTVSIFNGPIPECRILSSKDDELAAVASKLHDLLQRGYQPDEIGIFVRSESQMPQARAALKKSGLPWSELENTSRPANGRIAVSTMHLAKGLEFRAVIVMACDDEVIPLQERIDAITDEADLEEIYTTERHLLYVACTRAREELLVTATKPESEFLMDSFATTN